MPAASTCRFIAEQRNNDREGFQVAWGAYQTIWIFADNCKGSLGPIDRPKSTFPRLENIVNNIDPPIFKFCRLKQQIYPCEELSLILAMQPSQFVDEIFWP